MALVDIIVAVIFLGLGVVGFFRGFARQVLGVLGKLIAIIGAFMLIKPIFGLLMNLDFFAGLVESLGEAMSGINIGFLEPIAEAAGRTQGYIVSEFIFKIVVFIIIAIIVGLLYKLVKAIIIRFVGLPGIRWVDRALGAILGLVWAFILVVGLLFVLHYVGNRVEAVGNFMVEFIPEGCLTDKWIMANLDILKQYVLDFINFVKGIATNSESSALI